MSETMSTITVNVNVTNPGQFLACCGLLELADRLWPGTEAWFGLRDDQFALRVAAGDGAAEQLIQEIVDCRIQGLTAAQRKELDELEGRKRELRKVGRVLTEAEEKRRSELGRLTREGHLILERFQLTLDWWQEDGAPATWAGKQEIHKIARAAQDGIERCMAEGHPLGDLLDWQLVLRTPSEYRSEKGTDKKVEPFYFDARRYAHPLDAGFSLDVQGADTVTHPATEFLCLVGLQRFRPQQYGDSKWTLQYCAWGPALGVAQAAPVASGLVSVPAMRRFCFPLQFRDDQKRYKAFGFARPMGVSS
jgi:CRISPR-associated protein Csb3